jgi:hypothetical protein
VLPGLVGHRGAADPIDRPHTTESRKYSVIGT